MNIILEQRLICIVGAVALLSFAGKRKWITPQETGWIGSAMIFAATGWVLQAVLNTTIADFPNRQTAVLAGIGLTMPLDVALIVGLVLLVKNLKRAAASSDG